MKRSFILFWRAFPVDKARWWRIIMYCADVIIVGAGPSGMSAAYHIMNEVGKSVNVVVLEHKDKPGKKLLATGNGRCNFTNDILDDESYRGNNPAFAYELIYEYNKEWLIDMLYDIGIIHTSINGYYYPHSLQASAVNDSLIGAVTGGGAKVITDVHVSYVKKEKDCYVVHTDKDVYKARYVVVAAGGKSYKALGSDGSGYDICKKLGHSIVDAHPALCGINLKGISFKKCSGVRAKGHIWLEESGKTISESEGELQFTDYGLSGIPVFQISRYAKCGQTLHVDFAPDYTYSELHDMFTYIWRKNNHKSIEEVLNSFLPAKLCRVLAEHDGNIKVVCNKLKDLKLNVVSTLDFDKSQVTAGGVDVSEIDSKTMQSKLCDGLYIVGELLDIDGNCGGYNLHFAFASGACAGKDIGGRIKCS